jgi:hypothetical protein
MTGHWRPKGTPLAKVPDLRHLQASAVTEARFALGTHPLVPLIPQLNTCCDDMSIIAEHATYNGFPDAFLIPASTRLGSGSHATTPTYNVIVSRKRPVLVDFKPPKSR